MGRVVVADNLAATSNLASTRRVMEVSKELSDRTQLFVTPDLVSTVRRHSLGRAWLAVVCP